MQQVHLCTYKPDRKDMIAIVIPIFLVSFVIACLFIQKIIYVSNKKHLFDEPLEDRKIHIQKIPNLAGVAMFASVLLTTSIITAITPIAQLNYIFASSIILFSLGLTDDLVGVAPNKKILAQFGVALIIAMLAGLRFTSFYGILGLHSMPYAVSIILTTLFILLIINAFNLIDGINCLAAGIGFLVCCTFAICFWNMGQSGLMLLSTSVAGCLGGFICYNRTPAKIFMGDTGSLSLGFLISLFAINFIELNKPDMVNGIPPAFKSAPAITFGLLIIPIFDSLRVFILRILAKKSPFSADRNHVHHRLLDLNFSHMQATAVLIAVNIVSIVIVFSFGFLGNEILSILVCAFIIMLNIVSYQILAKRNEIKAKEINTITSNNLRLRSSNPPEAEKQLVPWQNYPFDMEEADSHNIVDEYLLEDMENVEESSNIKLTIN